MHDDDNDDDDADDFCMRPWDIVRTCHWWKESRQQFEVPPLPQSIFFVLLLISFHSRIISRCSRYHRACFAWVYMCVCRHGTHGQRQCDRVETMTHPLCLGIKVMWINKNGSEEFEVREQEHVCLCVRICVSQSLQSACVRVPLLWVNGEVSFANFQQTEI